MKLQVESCQNFSSIAANSFGDPQRVVSVQTQRAVNAPRFEYRFLPLSLTVLRWPLR